MIHIIGANGYIGTRLCKEMESAGLIFDCYSDVSDSKCAEFNLTESDCDSLDFCGGDVVVLLAAISSPDVCQNNYSLAYNVNVVGTSRLIDYCLSRDVRVIFLSSDTVNGPTTSPKDEYSTVEPFGNYARMKYEIELKYKNSSLFKTLRLSYVLSDSDKFVCYLKKCAQEHIVAEVFNGLYRNVIKLEIVLEAIIKLCLNFNFNDYYLVNVSGNQNLSRLDLAKWYKRNIDHNLVYKEIEVPETILNGRPNIIETKSLFLEKLLNHKIDNLLSEGDF